MKITFYRFCILLFTLLILLNSCASNPSKFPDESIAEIEKDTPHLNITVTVSPNAGYTRIPAVDILPDFPVDIEINNLTDLQITIDGVTTPLESAFQQELITPEEIFAYALVDARKGYCEQESTSIDGVTHHIFTYPMFDLAIVYDMLETPDGKQHTIQDMFFDMAYRYQLENKQFLYIDDKTGYFLDREDWGISLEVKDVTASGITLTCTQAGGQQFGYLEIQDYLLLDCDTLEFVHQDGQIAAIQISMDSTSDLTIDWSATHGELESGTYLLRIQVNDIYDASEVHPLMRNFYDRQHYDIEFTIP